MFTDGSDAEKVKIDANEAKKMSNCPQIASLLTVIIFWVVLLDLFYNGKEQR